MSTADPNNSGAGNTPINNGAIGSVVLNNHKWLTVAYPISKNNQKKSVAESSAKENLENKMDGCSCKSCEKFVPLAESNHEDGTFSCYECRMDW